MKKVVTLLFLRRDGQILLAMKKRGFGEGKWNGVGGKAEPGETPEAAIVRECQEEIGVTPRAVKQIGRLDFYMTDDPSFNHDCYVFTATEWEGDPQETEEMRPQWFAETQIPYDSMWAADKLWLPHLLKGKSFSSTITFTGDAVSEHAITAQD